MAKSAGTRVWNGLLFILLLPVRLLDFLLHATQLGGVEILAVHTDANKPEMVHLWYARTLMSSRYGDRSNASARMPQANRIPGEPGIWVLILGELGLFSIFFVTIAWMEATEMIRL